MEYSNYLNLNLPSINNTVDLAIIDDISENFVKLDKKADEFDGDIEQNASDIEGLRIINTASGSSIALKDSAISKLRNLKIFGKTEQDGIPTPDNPIELKSIGDSGSYEVGVYGKNLFDINGKINIAGNTGTEISGFNTVSNNILTAYANSATTHGAGQKIKVGVGTPITFSCKVLSLGTGKSLNLSIYENGTYKTYVRGSVVNETVKVTYTPTVEEPVFTFNTYDGTGAQATEIQIEYGETNTPYEPFNKQSITFTDILRGIGDIADEKDFARGAKIQRFGFEKISTYASNNSGNLDNGNAYIFVTVPNKIKARTPTVRCTHAKYDASSLADGTFFQNIGNFVLVGNSTDTYETLIAKYGEGYLLYELETPIETPLTEQEINNYKKLYTKKPNTTIISEAEMEISYVADPKNYIDNKIAELTALTLEV